MGEARRTTLFSLLLLLPPALAGEDLKLYRDTMRDYRRAGLHLDKATRDEVEALQKELARRSTDFTRNIGEAKAVVTFAPEELAGVPDGSP